MKTPKSAALQFHAWGANVNALGNAHKGPLHTWEQYQSRRQTLEEVQSLPWRNNGGVGVINGIGGWRTFDIDPKKKDEHGNKLADEDIQPVPESTLLCILQALGLPQDYAWVGHSGSGKGWGIAIICHDAIPTGVLHAKDDDAGVFVGLPKDGHEFGQIELRVQDCQTIFPPSAYSKPNAPGYQWRGDTPTSPPAVVTAGHVLNAFFAVATPKRTVEYDEPKASKTSTSTNQNIGRDPILDEIKQRFDLVAYAKQHWGDDTRKEPDGEIRVLGHGGFLINPRTGIWNNFTEKVGGDCFELVGYHLYDHRWNKHDGSMFYAAKVEAAAFAGVTLPEPKRVEVHVPENYADNIESLDTETLRQRLRNLIPLVQQLTERNLQLEFELGEVKKHNRFVTQTAGSEGIGSASMRLTFIEMKKEVERVPLEEREPDQFVRVRPAYMAKCTGQNRSTISRHLGELESAGYIEKKVERTYDPETRAWCSETFIRPLVDLSDPTQVVIPSKPRGKQACKKCSGHRLEERKVTKCLDCGHEEWSEPHLVNEPESELQTANQGEDTTQTAADFFEQLPDTSTDGLKCNVQHKEKTAVFVSELQNAHPLTLTPKPPELQNAQGVQPPGVRSGLIADDDPWFAYQREIQSKGVTP